MERGEKKKMCMEEKVGWRIMSLSLGGAITREMIRNEGKRIGDEFGSETLLLLFCCLFVYVSSSSYFMTKGSSCDFNHSNEPNRT